MTITISKFIESKKSSFEWTWCLRDT